MESDIMNHGKDLPPIVLSNTTIPYLVTLIPVLVSMTSQREFPSYRDESDKPAWWPDDVKWRNPNFYMNQPIKDSLNVLRKLVHSCYSYHGLEELLNRFDETPVSEAESELQDSSDVILITDDQDDGSNESSTESERPVFVCCFCLEQFSSHDSVQTHQSICQRRFQTISDSKNVENSTHHNSSKADTGQRQPVVPKSIKTANQNSPPAVKTSHISRLDDLLLTNPKSLAHDQVSGPPPVPHKKPGPRSSFKFVPTLKTRSQKKLDQIMEKHNQKKLMIKECQAMRPVPATGAWWKSKRRKTQTRPVHPISYLSADAFMSALSLVKKTELEARVNDTSRQEVDLDCEIISVEGPLSAVPSTVFQRPALTSPRSTRSLMSQLSREGVTDSRRRLSFCFVEDEWADKEALEEGRDPLQLSLLTLDLSSPLGQRIKKYVKGEGHFNIIKDAENYCRTKVDDDSYSKLRFRGTDFRITYKKKKRASTFVHKYKFNSSDKFEFKMLLKTGLSARSRHLSNCLPKCKVVVKRLTSSKIREWTEEKKISIAENIVYDDDICITQIDIPQSKLTQDKSGSLNHCSNSIASQFLQNSPSKPKLATSRTVLNHHPPPSPPHIPNIFRNRSHCSPSPTKPGPKSYHIYMQNKISKALDLSNFDHGSAKKTPVVANNNMSSSGDSFVPHLSKHPSQSPSVYSQGHPSQSPSVYSQGHSSQSPSAYSQGHPSQSPSVYSQGHSLPVTQRRLAGPSSRRKQQMTCVRRDGFEGGIAHMGGDQNLGYLHLDGSDSCVVSNSGRNSDSGGQAKNFRKLSNFDYFSIRNGKLHHPHPSPVSPAMHRPMPKSFQTNVAADRQSLQRPVSAPLKPKQVSTLTQPITKQKTFSDYVGSPGIRPQSSGHSRPYAMSRPPGVKQPAPNSLMDHLADTVSVPKSSPQLKSFMSLCPALDGEDEIMEIICVDDD